MERQFKGHTPDRPVTADELRKTRERVKAVSKTCELTYDWVYAATRNARLEADIRRVMSPHIRIDDPGLDQDDVYYTLTRLVAAITRDAHWLAHTSENALAAAQEAHYQRSQAERLAKIMRRKLDDLEVRFADPIPVKSIPVNELLEPHVYIFRDWHGNALYVGKSINVLSRLAQHRKRDFYAAAETVELIACDNEREMSELEQELIAKLDPPHNVVGRVAS